ncbi:MAG: nucleotide sugar dehydrogenase [Desulfococcaceae bacterium]|jgi:UDP-N-acetyl-D-galactosamine dehydrogenase|nr:nucleotide sugar dehydrogenase [Desulfococcaceae bacterium]
MVTPESLDKREDKIAVVGLGYVGLPLAVHLSAHFDVLGYDLKSRRIRELSAGYDRTLEVTDEELRRASLSFTDNPAELARCRLIIVAVPTPIDAYRIPDLRPLEGSSETVGKHMGRGSCIVFESTVYPGATEEVCVPIMEKMSGMTLGKDFSVGYSPERINPGDKVHSLDKIVKIVSASNAESLSLLQHVYGKVVKAGLHPASSIKVAEAAKVIENTQRDLNIALMNELAMIFDIMDIDTAEVLEAAGTKWNFLPFRPGLVGGHCIGVDPYYLTFKAESLGYHPDMILAGRRINDSMGKYVAERAVKMLIRQGLQVRGAKIAVLGLTFKEDVPDLRNTKIIDILNELKDYGVTPLVHDPLADPEEARQYYGIELQDMENLKDMDAVILAVMHRQYKEMGLAQISRICRADSPLLIDIKSAFSPALAKELNIQYWRL